jgi:PadR family transcriptional regulator, regulatory protein PadR
MKGERLGEFEELLLLAVLAVEGPPSVVPIQQYLEGVSSRSVSLGAVYAGLDRLERKGLVRSSLGETTPARGGKRKRVFSVTPGGERTARSVRHTREAIWKTIEER